MHIVSIVYRQQIHWCLATKPPFHVQKNKFIISESTCFLYATSFFDFFFELLRVCHFQPQSCVVLARKLYSF